MTVKSVVDIQVNDESFKNFSALFEKYKASLAQMPEGWKAVGDEVTKTGSQFEIIVAAMLAQGELGRTIAKAEKDAATAAEKKRKEEAAAARSGALHWKDMARTTRDVAGNIISATTALLKWSALTGVLTGIVGAGGLFGIERMAGNVASGRRSSQGLGVTYGEQKSFGVNYGSVVDTNSFLGSVNQALHSMTDKAGLIRAGMTPGEMQGGTAQVGTALLGHLKRIADTTNPAALSNVMQSRGLDQFVSLEDMMRLRAMSAGDFDKFQARNSKDAQSLDLQRGTQDAWLSFTQQMSRAGTQIENVFVNGLVKLAPRFEHLSESVVHLFEAVSKSPAIEKFIDNIANGLETFAGYVGTPKFQQDVVDFVEGVGAMAHAIASVLRFLGILPGEKKPDPRPVSPNKWWMLPPMIPGGAAIPLPFAPANAGMPDIRVSAHRVSTALLSGSAAPPAASTAEKFSNLEKLRGLPPGLLGAIYGAESSSGSDTRTSSAGAVGPMQLMPGTAAQYGVGNSRDLDQSSMGAAHYLQDLLKRFKGDVAKAVASYNWGEGNVEAYARTGKGKYGQDMPDETVGYLRKISQSLSRDAGQKIELSITTVPGANVIAQTSQVAPG